MAASLLSAILLRVAGPLFKRVDQLTASRPGMAAPQQAAVAAQGAAAEMATSDIALTGSMALPEPTLLDMVLCKLS